MIKTAMSIGSNILLLMLFNIPNPKRAYYATFEITGIVVVVILNLL
jgi:hypothetical protein